jgi:hypothetical protein
MAYNSNMPIGTPTPEEDLAGAQTAKIKQDAIAAQERQAWLARTEGDLAVPERDRAGVILRNRYKNGGPVTGKYTKGTGAVDIGDWTAPMKSRGGQNGG